MEALLEVVADGGDNRVTDVARACLVALGGQRLALKSQILEFDRRVLAWHRIRCDEQAAIPGIGLALATALVASVP